MVQKYNSADVGDFISVQCYSSILLTLMLTSGCSKIHQEAWNISLMDKEAVLRTYLCFGSPKVNLYFSFSNSLYCVFSLQDPIEASRLFVSTISPYEMVTGHNLLSAEMQCIVVPSESLA